MQSMMYDKMINSVLDNHHGSPEGQRYELIFLDQIQAPKQTITHLLEYLQAKTNI